jgi:hypothetical protein
MRLVFGAREDVWTYFGGEEPAESERDDPSEGETHHPRRPKPKTIDVLRRLAAAVTETVVDIPFKGVTPRFALEKAFERLTGRALLDDVVEKKAHVDDGTFDRNIKLLERVYGLTPRLSQQKGHRRARALLLLAAECGLSPLIEGMIPATDSWPATTRLDLRGAFHLVSRWWAHGDPRMIPRGDLRILPRLAVTALSLVEGEAPLPYPPLTRLYAGVLTHHRADDQIEGEAEELSRQTVAELYRAYERRASKREIMQALFAVAEDLGLIEPRPAFETEPELRRRQELTRVILDLELRGIKSVDTASSRLLSLIAKDLER